MTVIVKSSDKTPKPKIFKDMKTAMKWLKKNVKLPERRNDGYGSYKSKSNGN